MFTWKKNSRTETKTTGNEAGAALQQGAWSAEGGVSPWLDKRLEDIGAQDVTLGWADCMATVPLRVDPSVVEARFANADALLNAHASKLDFLSPESANSSMLLIASLYAEAWQGAQADLVAAEQTTLEKVRRLESSWKGCVKDVEGELAVVRNAIKELEPDGPRDESNGNGCDTD